MAASISAPASGAQVTQCLLTSASRTKHRNAKPIDRHAGPAIERNRVRIRTRRREDVGGRHKLRRWRGLLEERAAVDHDRISEVGVAARPLPVGFRQDELGRGLMLVEDRIGRAASQRVDDAAAAASECPPPGAQAEWCGPSPRRTWRAHRASCPRCARLPRRARRATSQRDGLPPCGGSPRLRAAWRWFPRGA